MKLRITTLSENASSGGDMLAEWGLSILIETDMVNVLLDTGRSISVGHNADMLGIDLGKVDKIVLSHSHADHTGGLRHVLRKMRKDVEVIAHPDIWADKWVRREGRPDRFVGVPFQRQEVERLGAIFNLTAKPVKITDSIMTTGEVPMITDFEKIEASHYIKEATGEKPDEIMDDQAIIINTEQGLVVVTGCAHHGVVNTIYHAQQITGVKTVHTVVGGCHLLDSSEERVWRTIAALQDLGVLKLGLCHCTGSHEIALMAQQFGDRFFFNSTGTVIELP